MKNRDLDTLPGGVSFVDTASPTGGIRAAFEVRLDLNHLLMDIQDVRERVRSTFYADLFLMLAGSDRTNMTATEVAERHEEKLLMLGPVLERLHNELLDPFIEMTFARLVRAGALPRPARSAGHGHQRRVRFDARAGAARGGHELDRPLRRQPGHGRADEARGAGPFRRRPVRRDLRRHAGRRSAPDRGR